LVPSDHQPYLYILGIFICQIIFFAQIYEYFQLSKYHQKKIVFWTALSIVWIFFPLIGLFLNPFGRSNASFFAPSPIFILPVSVECMMNKYCKTQPNYILLIGINLILALNAIFFAYLQRRFLRNKFRSPV